MALSEKARRALRVFGIRVKNQGKITNRRNVASNSNPGTTMSSEAASMMRKGEI